MSHSCDPGLRHDLLNLDPRVERAVAVGPAHALTALLLEHADFRPARLALDDADDLRVGDIRRARQDLAAVFFDQQYLADRDFFARLTGRAVQLGKLAGDYPHLPAARLNDCVHICPCPKPRSYPGKG